MMKIFKKLSAFICAGALACTAFAFSAFAENNEKGRVYVYNDAISASDEAECEKLLDEASKDKNIDLAVIFLNQSGMSDSEVKNRATSESSRRGNSVVMVVNYGTNCVAIDANGDCTKKLTNNKVTKIREKYVSSKLKSKDNVGAVKSFVKGVKRYTAFITLGMILIGLVGFLIFFMIMYFSVRAKYKFHEKPSTNNYLEGGALNFTVMEDVFVSEHTSRTAISSGSGGGGGGGSGHSSSVGHF